MSPQTDLDLYHPDLQEAEEALSESKHAIEDGFSDNLSYAKEVIQLIQHDRSEIGYFRDLCHRASRRMSYPVNVNDKRNRDEVVAQNTDYLNVSPGNGVLDRQIAWPEVCPNLCSYFRTCAVRSNAESALERPRLTRHTMHSLGIYPQMRPASPTRSRSDQDIIQARSRK